MRKTVACHALKACGLDDIAVLRDACAVLTRIPKARPGVQLNLNNETRMMLEASVDAARQMQVNFIGTEHLLLVKRERSTGTRILLRLGITPDQVRQQVYDIVQIKPGKQSHFSSFMLDPQVELLLLRCAVFFEISRERAAQYQSRELEPEHLLLGLLDGDDSATLALFPRAWLEQIAGGGCSDRSSTQRAKTQGRGFSRAFALFPPYTNSAWRYW
ncbi:MAG: Clp protease N-terminal domain-containing protein [Anaerolineae bacterium]